MRVGIAAHEAEAGNLFPVFGEQLVDFGLVEGEADVFVEVRTMAAGAVVRAIGDVDGEGHLVGNLLEYDVEVVVFEHGDYIFP